MNPHTSPHVCIIGAGPGGLTTGRALRRAGIAFEILDRGPGSGGIWDINNPGSPMYETLSSLKYSSLPMYAKATSQGGIVPRSLSLNRLQSHPG